MHEFSLIQCALEIAEEHARLQGATRIHRMILRVGKLSCVEPGALRFAFEVARDGTMAADAALEIEVEPVMCHCQGCGIEFTPAGDIFTCPECLTPSGDVRAGKELELVSLEASCDD